MLNHAARHGPAMRIVTEDAGIDRLTILDPFSPIRTAGAGPRTL